MATTTAPGSASGLQLSALPPASGKAGLGGALRSEFTKLRSVRSTYWTIAALFIVSVGFAAIAGAAITSNLHGNPQNEAGLDATQATLGGFFELGQLIIAVLGALVITSEYSTGMIRTSLTALPRRGTVFTAKLIVFGFVTLIVSLITSFIAFFVGQALVPSSVRPSLFHSITIPANANVSPPPGGPGSGQPPVVTFSGHDVISPGAVVTAIIGTALLVTAVALIAYGLGAIIRHTAGAITSAIGLMFVVPIIIQLLPNTWSFDLRRFIPSAAGQKLSETIGQNNPHLWSAWPQFGVTLIYAAVFLVAGVYLFRKRDA
jgi:ABC-type transport system involved in multi-copper enzyme maturation permease subunit